jgi:hypothetical protein
VDTVGSGSKRDIETFVYQQAAARIPHKGHSDFSQVKEISRGELFLTDLDQRNIRSDCGLYNLRYTGRISIVG